MSLPIAVAEAHRRAADLGFSASSEDDVGRLLSVLVAALSPGARVLELGTGAGVGLAWIVRGVGDRQDVEVVSTEIDAGRAEAVRRARWPEWVSIVTGDAAAQITAPEQFDLIFADAPTGKIVKLTDTINSLRLGGMLVVDDMDPARQDDPEWRERLTAVRDALLEHPALLCAELAYTSGVILAVRYRL